MEKLYVESAGTGIVYESDLPLYNFFIKNGNFLEFPGLKVKKVDDNFNCEYKLIYNNSEEKCIIVDDFNITINYPINEVNESSIIYPGYILLEKARINNEAVSIHSACVEKNDVGILLLGKTGSGKTTTAINLCKNYGYSLIANDVTVIKNKPEVIEALDGTKFVFLRYESIKRNLPELLRIFNDKEVDLNYLSNNNQSVDSWRKKTRVLPNEIGITSASYPVEIAKAYMLHVDENKEYLNKNQDKSLVSKLYLNEILSTTIRGINTTFLNNKYEPSMYIPSMDTPNHYEFRKEMIKKIIEDCRLEYLSGNINIVSECINNDTNELIRRRHK